MKHKSLWMKHLCALLSCVMLLFVFPASVFAATCAESPCTHEAEINGTHYETLAQAVSAATDGDTISILKDTALTKTISFQNNGTYTLLGNGHTLTYSSMAPFLSVTNGVTVNLGSASQPDASALTLDATHENRTTSVLDILGGTVNLYSGVTVCNNTTIGGTGVAGIRVTNTGTLNMYGGSIRNNKSLYLASAIFASGNSALNIYGGSISGNTATGDLGLSYGAIAVFDNAKATIQNCSITNNQSLGTAYAGGILFNSTQKGTVQNCVISGNSSSMFGGGITVLNGGLDLTGTTLSGNTALAGGGVLVYGPTCTMKGVHILNNSAIEVGGGIYMQGGVLSVDNTSAIYKNAATGTEAGGDDVAVSNASAADQVSLPTAAAMQAQVSGYALRGWYDDSPDTRYDATQHAVEQTTMQYTGAAQLFWKVPTALQHTVTVETDGNGTAAADITTAASGTTIQLSATPNAGYRFVEYQVVSGGVTVTDNAFTMPEGDVVVKAIFEKNVVTPPQDENPSTGDHSNTALWLLTGATAAMILFAIFRSKKTTR